VGTAFYNIIIIQLFCPFDKELVSLKLGYLLEMEGRWLRY